MGGVLVGSRRTEKASVFYDIRLIIIIDYSVLFYNIVILVFALAGPNFSCPKGNKRRFLVQNENGNCQQCARTGYVVSDIR